MINLPEKIQALLPKLTRATINHVHVDALRIVSLSSGRSKTLPCTLDFPLPGMGGREEEGMALKVAMQSCSVV